MITITFFDFDILGSFLVKRQEVKRVGHSTIIQSLSVPVKYAVEVREWSMMPSFNLVPNQGNL